MSIEEMLKSGMTPEEMIRDLHNQITKAQDKIKKEAEVQRDANRDTARTDLATALLAYLSTFEELENDEDFKLSEQNIKDMTKVIAEAEESILSMMGLIKTMLELEGKVKEAEVETKEQDIKKSKTTDDIINNFLKGII